jgi:hypothetical protein
MPDMKLAAVVAFVSDDQIAGPDARFLSSLFRFPPGWIGDLSIASSDRRVAPFTIDSDAFQAGWDELSACKVL